MKLVTLKMGFILYFVFFLQNALAFNKSHLQAGDVLLISINCYECRIIESETQSSFSHSGVVIVDELSRVRVAQSLGKLDHFSLEEFTKNITPRSKVHVYRPKEFKQLTSRDKQFIEKDLLMIFNEKFKNAPFDSKYLWNNFNSRGVELLYCSEFIAKFLDYFLKTKTVPLPMNYQKNFDFWLQYFRGIVPDGELGNSPASFSRDDRFEFVGSF